MSQYDWTHGGNLSNIIDFASGKDSAGNNSYLYLKDDGGSTTLYLSSDVTNWVSFSSFNSAATGISGAPISCVSAKDGWFFLHTDANEVYALTVGANSLSCSAIKFDGSHDLNVVRSDGDEQLIMCYSNGKVKTRDGIAADSPITERINLPAHYSAGTYAIDAGKGDDGWYIISKSPDGTYNSTIASLNWGSIYTESNVTTPVNALEVNYFPSLDKWYASDGETTVSTDDLSNWYSAHTPLWVAVGGSSLAYSADGTNWTEVSINGIHSLEDLTFGKNAEGVDTWYACSNHDANSIAYTTDVTDADSWTAVNPPGSGGGWTIEYSANGTIMLGREHENYAVRRSTDFGATWTNSTVVNPSGNNPKVTNSLATNGSGLWVAGFGNLGLIMKSYDDGVTWYKSADLGSDNHIGLEYANGVWVASEASKTINICTSIEQSDSLDTWTQIDPPGQRTPDSITYVNNGVWIVGGGRRNIWRSVDNAATWTQVTSLPNPSGSEISTDNNAYSLASDGVNVVATGRNGHINISTDLGDTWTLVHTMTTGQHMNSIEYNKVKPF